MQPRAFDELTYCGYFGAGFNTRRASFADKITGNKAANEITGAGGKDILKGGGGADTLIFTQVSDSEFGYPKRDIILDFTHGVDKIDLSAILGLTSFGGENAAPAIGQLSWISENLAGRKDDKVIIEIYLTQRAVDTDAEFQIQIKAVKTLDQNDFILPF